MPRLTRHTILALLALAAGCQTERPLAPAPGLTEDDAVATHREYRKSVTVLTRNLYIGADVDRVITALATPDPADDLPALLGALAVVQETDFPTRARAFAREIARTRPHVIGLQEVTTLDVDLTPLGIPAPIVHQDFLAILQAALQTRGLDYTVAAEVTNTSVSPLPGVSLVDRDVILVDPDRVEVYPGAVGRTFTQNIGTVAPGITIIRGWVKVNARIGHKDYTFASTHLESGSAPGLDLLRAAQATELIDSVGTAERVIMLGDWNDIPGSPMHQVVVGAGFTDTWAEVRPWSRGFTCCHVENLSNRRTLFTQRIDYVFSRGVEPEHVARVGLRHEERIRGPVHRLWASDHAGVVTLFDR
jgi:hypothetical protein